MARLCARLRVENGEKGLTLIELLVAAAMSVVIVGAAGTMLISAMKTQPKVSEKAQDVSTARWILERMTREIRNGVGVDTAEPSEVSFRTYVRHATCGTSTPLPSNQPATECQVTYRCQAGECVRIEANPNVFTGVETTIFSGVTTTNVFNYTPDDDPNFVGVTLRFPSDDGEGTLTVSDGATLRSSNLLIE